MALPLLTYVLREEAATGMTSRVFGAAALLAAVCAAPGPAAGTVDLRWDPVPQATGYRIYYGASSGQYAAARDVGNVTAATLDGLADCTTHYMAVKAYNGAGESAEFSNEVSGWPRPRITTPSPAAARQGDRLTLDIEGANFQPGASIEIDNPEISLRSATVLSCTRIQAAATIEPTAKGVQPAQIGRFAVSIINPDRVFGARFEAFEVRVDPARFDVSRSEESTRDRLDGKDAVWISRVFASQVGTPSYDPDADFDGDGWVDGTDLSFVASQMGFCWNGSTWAAAACAGR